MQIHIRHRGTAIVETSAGILIVEESDRFYNYRVVEYTRVNHAKQPQFENLKKKLASKRSLGRLTFYSSSLVAPTDLSGTD